MCILAHRCLQKTILVHRKQTYFHETKKFCLHSSSKKYTKVGRSGLDSVTLSLTYRRKKDDGLPYTITVLSVISFRTASAFFFLFLLIIPETNNDQTREKDQIAREYTFLQACPRNAMRNRLSNIIKFVRIFFFALQLRERCPFADVVGPMSFYLKPWVRLRAC